MIVWRISFNCAAVIPWANICLTVPNVVYPASSKPPTAVLYPAIVSPLPRKSKPKSTASQAKCLHKTFTTSTRYATKLKLSLKPFGTRKLRTTPASRLNCLSNSTKCCFTNAHSNRSCRWWAVAWLSRIYPGPAAPTLLFKHSASKNNWQIYVGVTAVAPKI